MGLGLVFLVGGLLGFGVLGLTCGVLVVAYGWLFIDCSFAG